MPFDPDQYLQKNGGFNPDAYLGGSGGSPSAPNAGETFLRSFGDTVAMGLGEPINALGAAAGSYLGIGPDVEKAGQQGGFFDRYKRAKEYLSNRAKVGAEVNPKAALSGLVGGIGATILSPRSVLKIPEVGAALTPVSGAAKSAGVPFLGRAAAGMTDAALMSGTVAGVNALHKTGEEARSDIYGAMSSPWNAIGAAAPALEKLPGAAGYWREKANELRARIMAGPNNVDFMRDMREKHKSIAALGELTRDLWGQDVAKWQSPAERAAQLAKINSEAGAVKGELVQAIDEAPVQNFSPRGLPARGIRIDPNEVVAMMEAEKPVGRHVDATPELQDKVREIDSYIEAFKKAYRERLVPSKTDVEYNFTTPEITTTEPIAYSRTGEGGTVPYSQYLEDAPKTPFKRDPQAPITDRPSGGFASRSEIDWPGSKKQEPRTRGAGLITDWRHRTNNGATGRPYPDSGYRPLYGITEPETTHPVFGTKTDLEMQPVSLGEWDALQTEWNKIVHEKANAKYHQGTPRNVIENDSQLRWLKDVTGKMNAMDEEAVAKAHPDLYRRFIHAKKSYGASKDLLSAAQLEQDLFAAGGGSEAARIAYPTLHGLMFQAERLGARPFRSARAKTYDILSSIAGRESQIDPATLDAVLIQALRGGK